MPDYKKMYYTLFRKVTDAVELLQNAQRECEDIFIEGDDPDVFVIKKDE